MAKDTQKLVQVNKSSFRRLDPFLLGSNSKNGKMDRSKVDTICLHWTAGSTLSGALSRLKKLQLGYHFFIARDGTIIQGAEADKRMNHAGVSFGPQGLWVNDYSIAISFIMTGEKGEGREFNYLQYNAVKNLILNLKLSHPQIEWVTGHHWVAPRQKIDPYTFPFDKLVTDLNEAVDNSGLSNGRDDVPNFRVWETGMGIQGDPLNQNGLTKQGDRLIKVFQGNEYEFHREVLSDEIESFVETNPTVADPDDFSLSFDEDFDPSVNGFKQVGHANTYKKINSFGQIKDF